MKAGLGLSVCQRPLVVADYDPSVLSFTGWWRTDFSASPWAGVASAGTSGTRRLYRTSAGAEPAVGAALNNRYPADFDGTSDAVRVELTNSPFTAQTLANMIGTGAWSCAMLLYADAVGDSTRPPAFSHTAGFWGIGVRDSGGTKAVVMQYDSARRYADAAMNLSEWSLIQARWTGTQIQVRVNGGAWSSTNCNAASSTASQMLVGYNSVGAGYFNGKIADIMIAGSTSFSDATFDNIRTYINFRYGLSV